MDFTSILESATAVVSGIVAIDGATPTARAWWAKLFKGATPEEQTTALELFDDRTSTIRSNSNAADECATPETDAAAEGYYNHAIAELAEHLARHLDAHRELLPDLYELRDKVIKIQQENNVEKGQAGVFNGPITNNFN
ncbi:hypothetical protein [Streptomyces subrutilus]|uniref:Uncharacterized protein n=1 Tax=Streptomyces subrutilus TaxID=36818 RepID=A0A1E5PXJ1_9ACTN|nr:hypothetical protein [Streptomyces subrutilus]OEJ34190.1 hypothetical protein BGK67_25185 [Streptomyces subrutilus]